MKRIKVKDDEDTELIERALPLPGEDKRPNIDSAFPRTLDSLTTMAEAKRDPRMLFGGKSKLEDAAFQIMAATMGAAVQKETGWTITEQIPTLASDAVFGALEVLRKVREIEK